MNQRIRIGIVCLVWILSGCAVSPKVQYSKITQPSDVKDSHFDTFAFQESFIKIDASKDAKAGKLNPSSIVVTSVPAEHDEFKLALTHADSWGVKTNLNLSKLENTDLVKEAGTEVSDNRVELIGKIGGVIAKIAAVAFRVDEGVTIDSLPISINTLVGMKDMGVKAEAVFGVTAHSGVTIDFGALSKDARPIAELPLDKTVSAFVYAACRSAAVKVQLAGYTLTKTVKIADPRFFQSVNFPIKGKITTHSECGVSVTSEMGVGVKSSVDIADALVIQATAIKDAIEAAKKVEK